MSPLRHLGLAAAFLLSLSVRNMPTKFVPEERHVVSAGDARNRVWIFGVSLPSAWTKWGRSA